MVLVAAHTCALSASGCPPCTPTPQPWPASASLVQYDDPVLLASDVEKKEGTVRRVCEPILSKPPPPPPKKEEPAAEAAPEAEMQDAEEVGPPPPPAADGEPPVEEPMEA